MIGWMSGLRSTLPVVVALLGLLTAFPSQAGQLSAIVKGKSLHVGALENWNEENYELGVEYEFSSASRWRWKIMANGFVDSVDNISYVAGGGLHRRIWDTRRFHDLHIDIGLNAFVMIREDVNGNRPFPGALPGLSIGNRYIGANLTYLPRKVVELLYQSDAFARGITGIVFLQLKLDAGLFGL